MPHQTQDWFTANCTDFIAKDEWLPNSPDLNPLDYHVWVAMLQAFPKIHSKPKPLAMYRIFERIIGLQNFNYKFPAIWQKLTKVIEGNFFDSHSRCGGHLLWHYLSKIPGKWVKKEQRYLSLITLPNVGQFLKFIYSCDHQRICNTIFVIFATTH